MQNIKQRTFILSSIVVIAIQVIIEFMAKLAKSFGRFGKGMIITNANRPRSTMVTRF